MPIANTRTQRCTYVNYLYIHLCKDWSRLSNDTMLKQSRLCSRNVKAQAHSKIIMHDRTTLHKNMYSSTV